MKIEYQEPNILNKLDDAITTAYRNSRKISVIRLSAPELEEFCTVSGYAFAKNCGYTYKHVNIAYDWSSYR